MSQETPTVTDVSRSDETESSLQPGDETDPETGMDVARETEPVDFGPGASEGGAALRFGSGFAAGMLVGGVVGILLNELPLAMFGGFVLGTVIGIALAARA